MVLVENEHLHWAFDQASSSEDIWFMVVVEVVEDAALSVLISEYSGRSTEDRCLLRGVLTCIPVSCSLQA
jgi:hypothetical protein